MRLIVLGGLLVSVLAAPSRAADAKKEAEKGSWKSFVQTLVKSLDHSSVSRYQKGTVRITAVAAIRGAGQSSDDPLKPYWKGGYSEKAAEGYKKETEEFSAAAKLLLDGKADEGMSGLQAFKKSHPKSVLLPDVDEALKQAQAAKDEGEKADPPAKADASQKKDE
jgi:hypothetical protein